MNKAQLDALNEAREAYLARLRVDTIGGRPLSEDYIAGSVDGWDDCVAKMKEVSG